MIFKLSVPLIALALTSVVLSAPLKRSKSTPKESGQLPADMTAFAADPSINAEAIYKAAQAANSKELGSYPTTQEGDHIAHIYGDWMDLNGVSVIHFIADMDVDCDGVAYKCPGYSSSQDETSFGALDATKVPYYVLPEKFTDQQKDNIKANALGAIICNGKMFYGIYGDQNGAQKEVIGEASLLLAQACFPNDKISGDNGHVQVDVLYIVFGSKVPEGVGKETINIENLKTLGDEQAKLLQTALQLDGSSGSGDPSGNTTTSALPSATGDGNEDRKRNFESRRSRTFGRRRGGTT